MVEIWKALLEAAERGETVALLEVVAVNGSAPRAAGARMLVWADGRQLGTIGGGNLEYRAIEVAKEALRTGQPTRLQVHLTRDLGMCCGGAMEVYIEPQRPVERLVIYGAGHVALPTAKIAKDLGFEVTVVDEREEWNSPERFPEVRRITTDARGHARALVGDGRTWVLLLTHEHALDQDLLEILLPREWAYLGMIGSRPKITKFFLRLRAAGMDERLFAKLHAPVGLDIGAVTPEEIAVSIAAELVRRRRTGEGSAAPVAIKLHNEPHSAG
jgi:xanthine dehydrogenase accessory factor